MTGGSKELIFAPGSETAAIEEDGNATVLHIPMPLILGPARERIFRGESVRKVGDFHLVDGGGFLAGACVAPATLGPREAAAYLYDALFAIIGGRPLCRIWNYVPRINDCDSGEENYREFNAGRLDAFLRHYGEEFRPRLPAASALGTKGGAMAIAFLAGTDVPEHFENPEQVPACDYPRDYGLQPPAFSRGTRVTSPLGTRWFLAGTASIKGHLSLGENCAEQMATTLDNIAIMERAMALPAGVESRWKVFVRNLADFEQCRRLFAEARPASIQDTMFLHADICRSSLLLEVEAVYSSIRA
ncbi:MAG: hypothetical protein RL088_1843 [Verrucomicrobiota bacterium]|jgi:hypothetical protein